MNTMISALDLPESLLTDDNHPEKIALPGSLKKVPISSAPQYTLYRLLRHLKPTSVLEIGSQAGSSALIMAMAFRDNQMDVDVTCVDPFYSTGDNDGLSTLTDWYNTIYKSGFKPGIQLLISTSEIIIPLVNKRFDFVFVDGSHKYEDVRNDSLLSLLLLTVGGYFLVHDYMIYESVRRACDEVVTVCGLPHYVNSIQKNYRGEVCGWMIARKTRDFQQSEIRDLLTGTDMPLLHEWVALAKKQVPSSFKKKFRKLLELLQSNKG